MESPPGSDLCEACYAENCANYAAMERQRDEELHRECDWWRENQSADPGEAA